MLSVQPWDHLNTLPFVSLSLNGYTRRDTLAPGGCSLKLWKQAPARATECIRMCVRVHVESGVRQYLNPECLTPDCGLYGFTMQIAAHAGSAQSCCRGEARVGVCAAPTFYLILVVKVVVNFHIHLFDLHNRPFKTLFLEMGQGH